MEKSEGENVVVFHCLLAWRGSKERLDRARRQMNVKRACFIREIIPVFIDAGIPHHSRVVAERWTASLGWMIASWFAAGLPDLFDFTPGPRPPERAAWLYR